ncbi:hypothetical protein CONLIGDRAFT_626361 [Coniochaeta ligniaria NRRL 30616]|uniref:Uncharacterized protein n=1 Tax=Coniochaeta ligniaria NRRL 30616 TaxID=1408157 RepID=A0A1J7J2M5_9PEZI|nr:hypothetical protein CONLIGDRAFT_626361 [Coniochaeta ligniaria NRRL 30616]
MARPIVGVSTNLVLVAVWTLPLVVTWICRKELALPQLLALWTVAGHLNNQGDVLVFESFSVAWYIVGTLLYGGDAGSEATVRRLACAALCRYLHLAYTLAGPVWRPTQDGHATCF